ncbi:glucokinase [Microbacterium resistens]|uniref:Glucokinase n=1 Tax=Microbacterium resistens TaxID=156977 RepID=A0ABU1S8U8_9MICO|nr:ROK family protein [Microbacterium resistens]MDR6866038.1 glucokinase [Microbacterium resistens]
MSVARVLGLDVGGSSVKCLLVEADADARPDAVPRVVRQERRPTPKHDPLSGLQELIAEFAAGEELSAVTVSVPGIVDEDGVVIRSSNVPALDGHPLAAVLSDGSGLPVRVVNDGHAAALAEASWGAGSGRDDVFVLALGTGIAGAHIVGGRLSGGAHGSAGELGHISVDNPGAPCSCGRNGCLETVVGAPALAAAWHRVGGTGGVEDLLHAYEEGVETARHVVRNAVAALSEAVLTLSALVDPGCIVIGGGLASAPHRLVTLTAERVAAEATFHRVPPIRPATLGGWAGAHGAVRIALDAVRQSRSGDSAASMSPSNR